MGNTRYVIEDGGVLIVKPGVKSIGHEEFKERKDIRKVVLPRTIIWIDSCAFWGCKNLKTITFCPGLEKIDYMAFCGCESLARIDLPEGLTEIGHDAFSGCLKLKTVNMPSSLSKISDMAFNGCTSLKQIVIPSGAEVHKNAFYKCNNLGKVIIRDVNPLVSKTEKRMAVLLENPVHDSSGNLYAIIFRVEPDDDADAYARCFIIDLISKSFRNSATFLDWEEDGFKPSNVFSDFVREAGSDVKYAVVDIPEDINLKTVQLSGLMCVLDKTLHRTVDREEWKPLFLTATVKENGDSDTSSVPDSDPYDDRPIFTANSKEELIKVLSELKIEEGKPYVVCLPEGSTTVSENAFWGANSIGKVILQDSLKEIGNNAFIRCSGLTDINLPESLTRIGNRAFAECESLASISLPESISDIGKEAFYGCQCLDSVSIPCSVTKIEDGLFSSCHNLTAVQMPDSVKAIGAGAFRLCSGLKNVTIPSALKTIGDSAFFGCTNLSSFDIPASVTDIGDSPLGRCSGLLTISVSPDNPRYDSRGGCNAIIETATGRLIAGCCNTVIPDTVSVICDHAFMECKALKEVIIPDSVTEIGDLAFYGCHGITEIKIPRSVARIGKSAFQYCQELEKVRLPESLTEISEYTFESCKLLTEIFIPGSVTKIGRAAFFGCSVLTAITIPDSVVEIDEMVFKNCTYLKEIHIKNPALIKLLREKSGLASDAIIIIDK